ncbi:MAG: hypothetical protein Q8P72_00335 [Candidatus Roizmanbacteria bacterium]|uniref:Uncharacterized protein n=2 Tax=Candidatus Roizmaniibacteriota TaxID=1752723 RepID=A0A2M8F0H0_9BACT|nr:hypothetical protein [Candidatus Roizmanbacteria bacterium]PIZ65284.1 MAG: hypothetical protein COY15_03500 [Candidatus Roizmanbacteria bacterium CG_4_10_14_0_2_um_filter_39_12]PJC32776.1 MAG: hypothetical protein CO051_02535 [Candidatus Roizmanbacteria bacterium CG_4_9_14_0_2_um_filter_39_13]PJE61308.1 MAG: hypothetical protein COU87_05280 [Candidatus Roizmanbacteria bacterium CG10_big_fil_rev_8_21_14_0_10_39_12]
MELNIYYYIAISAFYIVLMQNMLSTSLGFQSVEIVALFVIGGFIGYAMDSYMIGFLFASIMHFLFWSHGGD